MFDEQQIQDVLLKTLKYNLTYLSASTLRRSLAKGNVSLKSAYQIFECDDSDDAVFKAAIDYTYHKLYSGKLLQSTVDKALTLAFIKMRLSVAFHTDWKVKFLHDIGMSSWEEYVLYESCIKTLNLQQFLNIYLNYLKYNVTQASEFTGIYKSSLQSKVLNPSVYFD